MFNWVLRNVIGGDTGKRELCLMVLAWWFLLSVYLLAREARGGESEIGLTLWKVYTPFAFAMTAGAFGLDWHHKQNKGAS